MSKAKGQLTSKHRCGGFVCFGVIFFSINLYFIVIWGKKHAGIFQCGESGSMGRKQWHPRARGSLQKARKKSFRIRMLCAETSVFNHHYWFQIYDLILCGNEPTVLEAEPYLLHPECSP